jgi:hypothetical protein
MLEIRADRLTGVSVTAGGVEMSPGLRFDCSLAQLWLVYVPLNVPLLQERVSDTHASGTVAVGDL